MLTIHKQHSLFPVLAELQRSVDALRAEISGLTGEISLTVALRNNGDISDDECDEIRQDIWAKQYLLELEIRKQQDLPGDAYLLGYDKFNNLLVGGELGKVIWDQARQEAQALKKAQAERRQALAHHKLFNLQARARFRA